MRRMITSVALHRRAALSATASKTGWMSLGDLLDDLQNFGGRRLPLERLFRLVEQARVFDRDHRLVGKRANKSDLLIGERPHFRAVNRNAADHLPFLEQRHHEKGAPPTFRSISRLPLGRRGRHRLP